MRNCKKFHNFAAVAILILLTAVIGCGKNIENQTESTTSTKNEEYSTEVLDRTVKENSENGSIAEAPESTFDPAHEFDDISGELLSAVPDLDSLTKKQLEEMTMDEFRAFIKIHCPNYRTVFGIYSDREMTESDWDSLKHLVNYNLFGSLWFDVEAEEKDNSLTEEEQMAILEEAKLEAYGITKEDIDVIILEIDNFTNEDLVAFFEEVFKEQGYDTSVLLSLTEEEIEEFKVNLKTELEKMKDIIE